MRYLPLLRRLLPGLWAGALLAVALVATPAPFALLAPADAGRVVSHILAHEAYLSLALGVVLLALERLAARSTDTDTDTDTDEPGPTFSPGLLLALGALFCTVAGYFALQPMMAAAQAGQGPLSFGQLHALSAAFYFVKTGLVAALAWRAAGQS